MTALAFCEVPCHRILISTAEDTSFAPPPRYLHVISVHVLVCRADKAPLVTNRLVCLKSKFLTSFVNLSKICNYSTTLIHKLQREWHDITSFPIWNEYHLTLFCLPTVATKKPLVLPCHLPPNTIHRHRCDPSISTIIPSPPILP